VESYAGAPLFDCRGGSLGVLVVLSSRPLRDPQIAKSVLDIYAARIAAELERMIAEHTLHLSEQRYQALFESAGDAILLLRGDHFVDCNPKALQMFGCTRAQLLGKTASVFESSPESGGSGSMKTRMEKLDEALRGEGAPFDWRARKLDGTAFDANVSLSRIDDFGTPHLLAHIRDVTHSREAERRVQESEERFRAIFESAGIGIAVVDVQGRVVESNPAVQTFLGYGEAAFKGMDFSSYSHPADLPSDIHLFRELFKGTRERYQMEKRYIHKDGQLVWGMLTASLVRSPNGEPQYCIRMAEDITARKRSEQALRESEEMFRLMLENAPDSIYIVADRGQILEVNGAACTQIGESREHLIGRQIYDFIAPRFAEVAARRLQEKVEGTFETAHIRADGTEVPVEFSVHRINFRGQAARLGLAREIKERRPALQQADKI
jgi:PAS domain S-box-containing protein